MSDFNETVIREFREGGGWSATFGEAPLILLTTVGARSGLTRTSPLMYLADDQNPNVIYVFASNAGSERDPSWLHNLRAHPATLSVEIGTTKVAAVPTVLEEAQRRAVYDRQAARYPGFADYERTTSRTIPVVALELVR